VGGPWWVVFLSFGFFRAVVGAVEALGRVIAKTLPRLRAVFRGKVFAKRKVFVKIRKYRTGFMITKTFRQRNGKLFVITQYHLALVSLGEFGSGGECCDQAEYAPAAGAEPAFPRLIAPSAGPVERVRVRADAAARALVEGVDSGRLFGGELEVEQAEVLLQPL
jgi:hypothetical protein